MVTVTTMMTVMGRDGDVVVVVTVLGYDDCDGDSDQDNDGNET